MYTKQEIIIRSHREGHSQRKIARDLHISRKMELLTLLGQKVKHKKLTFVKV